MLIIQSKKTDYDGEILDIKSKYFTTADYNGITYEKLEWNALKCVLMNNQECKIKAEVIDNKSNKSLFHHYSIFVKKMLWYL